MASITVDVSEVMHKLDPREFKLAMTAAGKEIGKEVKRDFQKPTRTWRHKVGFEVLTNVTSNGIEILAGTDDKIFGWLEHGTRPHWIRPKRAKALRFMSGFHPKTTPGHLGSGQGGSYGDIVFSRGVRHPGTKPRRWLPIIARRAEKFGRWAVNKHLTRWAR